MAQNIYNHSKIKQKCFFALLLNISEIPHGLALALRYDLGLIVFD